MDIRIHVFPSGIKRFAFNGEAYIVINLQRIGGFTNYYKMDARSLKRNCHKLFNLKKIAEDNKGNDIHFTIVEDIPAVAIA